MPEDNNESKSKKFCSRCGKEVDQGSLRKPVWKDKGYLVCPDCYYKEYLERAEEKERLGYTSSIIKLKFSGELLKIVEYAPGMKPEERANLAELDGLSFFEDLYESIASHWDKKGIYVQLDYEKAIVEIIDSNTGKTVKSVKVKELREWYDEMEKAGKKKESK